MRNKFLPSLSKETIFSIFFTLVAIIFVAFYFVPEQNKTTTQKKIKEIKNATVKSAPVISKPSLVTSDASEDETQTPTESEQTIQITIIITPTKIPSQSTQTEKVSIQVNVDGQSFSLDLDKGKTQCDVLQKALDEKKISQLLMKYDSSLDAYGVYQINTLGKENAVWWTYMVNGKTPSTGCNHIAANNGDSVSWQYVGQR